MSRYSHILKGRLKGDTLFTVVEGKPTNAPIHEALLKGKEDDSTASLEYVKSTGASKEIQSLFS